MIQAVLFDADGVVQQPRAGWIDHLGKLIGRTRALGTPCYLASNQEANRASFMSTQLGFGDVFDSEFHSCGVGAKKPETPYFTAVADELGAPLEELLLFDDKQENVDAARSTRMGAELYHHRHGIQALLGFLARHGVAVS